MNSPAGGRRRAPQAGPGGLCAGMVVYDRTYDMVGVVDNFVGPLVSLSRPTGLTWQSRWASVRQGPNTRSANCERSVLCTAHATRG
ncbi:hypothetical protein [Streptomyces sp. NPDC088725]|uniref:hypothetical protein n=1 Tax=Streptomyces sp. NPDC088725 TaxID=3365873 RepID=UPI0037FB2E7C